jgi:glucokinase
MGLTVGVDVGGTKVLAGVVDEDGRIVEQAKVATPTTDPQAIAEVIASMITGFRGRHQVDAVGIGAAGFIDAARSNVMFAANLIWRDEPLQQRVSKLIDLPVVVENDGNCHAWAEARFGAGRNSADLVCAIIGTGIGGGIVLSGELYRGGFGVAGEFGHYRVVPGGRLCGCGNHGCWEQYASGNALVREAREIARLSPISMPTLLDAVVGDIEAINGPLVTEAARRGDVGALEAFAIIGRWLGEGLADLAEILDPSCLLIGGGVSDAGELLYAPARAAFAETFSGGKYRPHPLIVGAELGSAAGLVGAADLARRP